MTAQARAAIDEAAQRSPGYNPMFERLVDTAGDRRGQLVGLVAYGLYKIAKREWAADLRDELARGPTEEELRAYLRAWTPSRIDGLRAEAADILGAFSRDVVEAAAPQIRDEAVAGEIRSSLSRFEAAARPTFRKIGGSILLSMAGALFYTLLLFIILLALRAAGIDILSIANNVEAILPSRPGDGM